MSGIRDEMRSMSAISARPTGHCLRNPAVTISTPTTIPRLKTFEPSRSPTDRLGAPFNTEKTATSSSGVDVMTERSAKPAEVSPRPVISMSSSTDPITNLETKDRTAKDAASVIADTTGSFDMSCMIP